MKLTNLLNKIRNYSSTAPEFNKIELYSKKLNDLKLLSSFINNNFKVKKSGLFNYIPKEDSYRLRLVIENNRYSQEYTKMIESFAFNNKMKTALVNHENFVDHEDAITVSNINEVKPLLSMIDINLKKNVFRKDSFAYSHNSSDFNDICGNYINFVKENSRNIDIVSFGIEDAFRPNLITELDKHNLVKFFEFFKAERKLKNKILAIKTSNCQVAELMLNMGVHIIYDESGATMDSNILSLVKDQNCLLFLGNHVLTKHMVEANYDPEASYDDVFIYSLLERMELLYAKGILNENVYFDPCYGTFKYSEGAKFIFDNVNLLAENYDCQIINAPRLNLKDLKSEFLTEENRNSSSIIKFDSVKNFRYEYSKVFTNLKNNPVPSYSEAKITYNDYGVITKEQEKVKVTRDENEDIFSRDRNNFVKEDVILNIMKKLNKN